jgi:hypothetical protein
MPPNMTLKDNLYPIVSGVLLREATRPEVETNTDVKKGKSQTDKEQVQFNHRGNTETPTQGH